MTESIESPPSPRRSRKIWWRFSEVTYLNRLHGAVGKGHPLTLEIVDVDGHLTSQRESATLLGKLRNGTERHDRGLGGSKAPTAFALGRKEADGALHMGQIILIAKLAMIPGAIASTTRSSTLNRVILDVVPTKCPSSALHGLHPFSINFRSLLPACFREAAHRCCYLVGVAGFPQAG